MTNTKTIIILQEGLLASIVKDIVTFSGFAGLLWFNHAFLSGTAWLDVVFILIVVLLLVGRTSSQVFRGPRDEALKWLESQS